MPEKMDHTPAYKIFHYYYQCQIPQHFLYSQEFVATFGLPTTGKTDIDRELSQSMVPAQLTIAEMAEALDDGANIVLTDPHEAVTIYNTIYAHLEQWRVHATEGLGGLEPPIDDLRKLDALASQVHKVGRAYMPKPTHGSSLLQNLERLEGRRKTTRRPGLPAQKPVFRDHEPISELIAKESFERNNRWR